jgi:flagellar biosynthesis/type III secretory pathway chaperone
MKEKLKEILKHEFEALNALLASLNEQFISLTHSEALKLEAVITKIDLNCREIAKWEVERRKLLEGKEISLVIREIGDKQLETSYRDIKKLIAAVQVQKESNDMLIKQGFAFTTKILNILNPDRTPKTYKSNGKRR